MVLNKSTEKGQQCPQPSLANTNELIGHLLPSNRFGDDIPQKRQKILRIGFQNIGGFSTTNHQLKDDLIRRGITKWEFDIFGLAETNIDWRLQHED